MHDYIEGKEAARLLGVSRRTTYRWAHEGRIAMPFERNNILAQHPAIRPRGPKRNPLSRRYTIGRHSFSEKSSG